MTKKIAATPRFTTEITETEKRRAKQVKKLFKGILRQMDKSLQTIYDLRDAVVQDRPSKDDLKNKYFGRFLRYRRVITTAFNGLLNNLKVALTALAPINDPEMVKLRGLIVAEFDELSDGVESFLALLGDPDKEGWTKSVERIVAALEKRQQSIRNSIDNQLFGHLENDILGKLKISEVSLRARMIKRTRLLRML